MIFVQRCHKYSKFGIGDKTISTKGSKKPQLLKSLGF